MSDRETEEVLLESCVADLDWFTNDAKLNYGLSEVIVLTRLLIMVLLRSFSCRSVGKLVQMTYGVS